MPRNRSHPSDHVHFAPRLADSLRWMGYWVASRVANATRALRRHWQTRLRPALEGYGTVLLSRVRATLHRPARPSETQPYPTLAEAVRQRGLADASG